MANSPDERKVTLVLQCAAIEQLDRLRKQWGMRSRGPAIERLLEIISKDESELEKEQEASENYENSLVQHVQGALVLISLAGENEEIPDWQVDESDQRPSAIDLPGFVSKRTQQLRRSLRTPVIDPPTSVGITLIDSRQLDECIQAVQTHWMNLYGSEPNQAVLEAGMHWLSHDIWPLSDASEGNMFTWNALQQVMIGYAPSWELRDPSVDRVIIAAGLLEDPFGGLALKIRIPSLVGRMTQRLKRRRRGTPFLDLQATMTTQGALQLLKLPTSAGCSLTLQDIREAYRHQAVAAHPDAGGDPEEMRRLNEAYQLLKQRYLKPL